MTDRTGGSHLVLLSDETRSPCRQRLAQAAAGAGLTLAVPSVHGQGLEDDDEPAVAPLRAPGAAGVAVAGRHPDRCLYWAAQALATGLPVLVEPLPPGATGPAAAAIRQGAATGQLRALARAAFSPVGEALLGVPESGDRVVAVELSVAIPRTWATADGPGVLADPGMEYLGLLEPALGPVDALWARSRSLLRHGPTEDWALLAARCRDGTEAWVQFSALGHEATVRLQLHGRHGTRALTQALPAADGPELASACQHFVALLVDPMPPPRAWGHDYVSALNLWAWAQQSARLGGEIPRWQARLHSA